jgi:hypothetical protein
MGTLAGSTIMLLTVAWGGSLLAGRCDIGPNGRAVDKTTTRGWDLLATGVTTDTFTPKNAVVMVATSALYLIIQVCVSALRERAERFRAHMRAWVRACAPRACRAAAKACPCPAFLQVPVLWGDTHNSLASLIGAVTCILCLAAYCVGQVTQPAGASACMGAWP